MSGEHKINIEIDLRDAAALPTTLTDKIKDVRALMERRADILSTETRDNFLAYIGQLERSRDAIIKAIDPDGRVFS